MKKQNNILSHEAAAAAAATDHELDLGRILGRIPVL